MDGSRWLVKNAWKNKTMKEGENHLKAILSQNSKDTLESIFGKEPDFKVIKIECDPTHSEPFRRTFEI